MKNSFKRYSELTEISNFEDRLSYLDLSGVVGVETFGCHRYLNQILYHSSEWRRLRNKIIERDNGCDLAHEEYPLCSGNILIHHLNPITIDDVRERRSNVFDPENLICCSYKVHRFIHYGVIDPKLKKYVPRKEGDTCPWK